MSVKEQAYGSANGTYRPSASAEQKMFTIIATERGKRSERYFEKAGAHVYVRMRSTQLVGAANAQRPSCMNLFTSGAFLNTGRREV